MMRTWATALLVTLAAAGAARAQPAQVEVALTGGASTESIGAIATQLRVFGEPREHLRFFVEAAWATRSDSQSSSDAFGAAYPYDKRVRVIEAYGEALRQGERLLLGLRAGQYRTPFGIYGRSDHAYTGFLRAPLIRYDDYFALSNNFLEAGANLVAGTPRFHGELSVGAPQDVGTGVRQSGLNQVVRLQAYHGPVILGASYIHSRPYDRRSFVRGDLEFTGVDLRLMLSGVQIRGEWINGQPFNNATTTGWYLDAIVHRPILGPVTLVARAEHLDYDAGRFSSYDKRTTAGARVQITPALVGQVNVMRQPRSAQSPVAHTELDAALTWVVRYPR